MSMCSAVREPVPRAPGNAPDHVAGIDDRADGPTGEHPAHPARTPPAGPVVDPAGSRPARRTEGPSGGHDPRAVRLWSAFLARRDRSLRDLLVLHHTPLLRSVAHRVAQGLPAHVDLADLVQAGVFGLVDAVERFDPQHGARFETYAAQRIRGAILDDLRAQDWVPRSVRGRARELERAQERLEVRLQRTATDAELASELGVAVRDLRAARQAAPVVDTLDELRVGSGADLLVDEQAPDPSAVLQARETARLLTAAVGLLAERDRTVVRLYYVENRTLAEIGRLLGVTESRVCQLHSRLVVRLRARMAEIGAG